MPFAATETVKNAEIDGINWKNGSSTVSSYGSGKVRGKNLFSNGFLCLGIYYIPEGHKNTMHFRIDPN